MVGGVIFYFLLCISLTLVGLDGCLLFFFVVQGRLRQRQAYFHFPCVMFYGVFEHAYTKEDGSWIPIKAKRDIQVSHSI